MSDEDYRRIAALYTDALTQRLPPTKAVQQATGMPRSTVSRHLREARRRGYLTAAAAGMPNHKTQRVADALGVTREALVRAVIEYADGDLRIQETRW